MADDLRVCEHGATVSHNLEKMTFTVQHGRNPEARRDFTHHLIYEHGFVPVQQWFDEACAYERGEIRPWEDGEWWFTKSPICIRTVCK